MINSVVSNTERLNDASEILYSYDEYSQIITVYELDEMNNEENSNTVFSSKFINSYYPVKIDNNGMLKYIQVMPPEPLSLEEVRSLIGIRLWLYKVDLYNNTSILDFSQTPIRDGDYIEWYPLLEEFSTIYKMQDYLKTVMTDNLAEHYINNTSIRLFGNDLYDIGGKVSLYSYNYDGFIVEQVFVSDTGYWQFYKVIVPDTGMSDTDVFMVGLLYTQEGWRIAYSTLKNESEFDYLDIFIRSDNNKIDNPSTSDNSFLYPLLLIISACILIVYLIIRRIKKKNGN